MFRDLKSAKKARSIEEINAPRKRFELEPISDPYQVVEIKIEVPDPDLEPELEPDFDSSDWPMEPVESVVCNIEEDFLDNKEDPKPKPKPKMENKNKDNEVAVEECIIDLSCHLCFTKF
jgi:hypothetical protein